MPWWLRWVVNMWGCKRVKSKGGYGFMFMVVMLQYFERFKGTKLIG